MRKLFKYGRVVDYATKLDDHCDILIDGDIIIAVAPEIDDSDARIVDCTGLTILPGLIDIHCHLRDPGYTYKESIQTGCWSAIRGGYTIICPMPNTNPVADCPEVIRYEVDKSRRYNLCVVHPYSSVTMGENGKELVNFVDNYLAGAIAFSDDGRPIEDVGLLERAMLEATQLGTFIAEHCEDMRYASGVIDEGPVAVELGVPGISRLAEEEMVKRDIAVAERLDTRIHICHISTRGSVEVIRAAKTRGVLVTCETCPHYFSFTAEEVRDSDTNAKMNPPLRNEDDRLAIIEGLQDNTIDCISTDHAPHSKEDKMHGLEKAPNGIIGFETALSAAITNLVVPGYLTFYDLSRLMSYKPSRLLGLPGCGSITPGNKAHLTIVDPDVNYIYQERTIASKSKNSPWIGKELTGRVIYTVVNGHISKAS